MSTTERRILIIPLGRKVEGLRRDSTNDNRNLLPYNQPRTLLRIQVGLGVALLAKSFLSDHHYSSVEGLH